MEVDCNGWPVHAQAKVYRGVLHSLKMGAPVCTGQSSLEADLPPPPLSAVAQAEARQGCLGGGKSVL